MSKSLFNVSDVLSDFVRFVLNRPDQPEIEVLLVVTAYVACVGYLLVRRQVQMLPNRMFLNCSLREHRAIFSAIWRDAFLRLSIAGSGVLVFFYLASLGQYRAFAVMAFSSVMFVGCRYVWNSGDPIPVALRSGFGNFVLLSIVAPGLAIALTFGVDMLIGVNLFSSIAITIIVLVLGSVSVLFSLAVGFVILLLPAGIAVEWLSNEIGEPKSRIAGWLKNAVLGTVFLGIVGLSATVMIIGAQSNRPFGCTGIPSRFCVE